MKIDLIEQLGGYAKAKRELELKEQDSIFQCCTAISAEMIRDALLQYRRQHNIFEVGDHFVNHCDDCIYVVLSLNGNGYIHGKSGDKNVWTYSGRFGVRHAEPEEIQANRRLDQIKCWSCDKTMMHKQRSENDGFCIHCNAEVCGG